MQVPTAKLSAGAASSSSKNEPDDSVESPTASDRTEPGPWADATTHMLGVAPATADRPGRVVTLGGELIGIVGGGRDAEAGTFEIGYWIAPMCWGQGIATEAAGAFKQHLIKTFGVQSLTADHFEDNPASGRVLAKLGFVETGRGEDFCMGRDMTVPVIHMAWTARPQKGGRHE